MLLGIETLSRLLHDKNAPAEMFVTVLGIVTLIRFMQSENAYSPILVTERPPIELGIPAAPGPKYPVIVIVPLFVIYEK